MNKIKSYLKNIQNNEEYQKDIKYLEDTSNGREDKKLKLDIILLSIFPLVSMYITYFLSFSNVIAIFVLIITAIPLSYKIARKIFDHMYKDEDRFQAIYRNFKKGKFIFLILPIIALLFVIGSSFLFRYLIFKLNNISVEILRIGTKVAFQITFCFIQAMGTTMFLTILIYTILVLLYGRLLNE